MATRVVYSVPRNRPTARPVATAAPPSPIRPNAVLRFIASPRRYGPGSFRWPGRSFELTSAALQALSKLVALFGRHLLPALHHSVTPVPRRWSRAAAQAAEQNSAQDQDAQGLPEGDSWASKQARHQPVPEDHHEETGNRYRG